MAFQAGVMIGLYISLLLLCLRLVVSDLLVPQDPKVIASPDHMLQISQRQHRHWAVRARRCTTSGPHGAVTTMRTGLARLGISLLHRIR
jgi:hypothetical protein